MVWIWQALYGRHLRWYGENHKIDKKEEKKSVPKWEPVLDPALTPKRRRFGAEITCDNDFGGSQVVKKRGLETSTEKRSD